RENFEKAKGSLTAEPLYILLAKHVHPNAHETSRRIALKASEKNSTVLAEAITSVELAPFIAKFSKSEKRLLEKPELYTGIAAKKTAKTCAYWKKKSRL
ncbi:MAG: adenylosuccinate lyase, partial [Candidatus Diapherotrites archaeon]